MSNIVPNSTWSSERIELMKALWAEGLSASIIAQRLGGVTRSAVCGKLFRLNVQGRPAGVNRRPKRAAATPRRRPVFPVRRDPARVKKPALPPESPPQEPVSLDIALLDLQSHHCRWAHGNGPFLFCGHRNFNGLPYCEHHASRCYQVGTSIGRRAA